MILVAEELAGRKKVPGPLLFDDTHCLLKLLGNLSLLLLFPLIISFSSSARKRILTGRQTTEFRQRERNPNTSFHQGSEHAPAVPLPPYPSRTSRSTPPPQESHRFHRHGISLLKQEVWEVEHPVSGCPRGKEEIHQPSCLITNSHPQNNQRKSICLWVGWEQEPTSSFSIGTFYLDR